MELMCLEMLRPPDLRFEKLVFPHRAKKNNFRPLFRSVRVIPKSPKGRAHTLLGFRGCFDCEGVLLFEKKKKWRSKMFSSPKHLGGGCFFLDAVLTVSFSLVCMRHLLPTPPLSVVE